MPDAPRTTARPKQRPATPAAAQLALGLPPPKAGRGGARTGAGRKPTRKGSWHPHTPRPWHDRNHPLHVTLRVDRRGHLRRATPARAIGKAVRAATRKSTVSLDLFRIAHFSIQHDHVHLIIESSSKGALARGMKGLACRLAKTLNRTTGRRGQVLRDRYHARPLTTPLEVRNCLRYVLQNAAKHAEADAIPDLPAIVVDGIDPWSSATWFEGWQRPPPPAADSPVARPRTWLLRSGWKRHGLLRRLDAPAGS